MTENPRQNPMKSVPDWRVTMPLAHSSPRCGAQNRAGTACQSPAMGNGRCRLHGGLSTGPKTAEGLARRLLSGSGVVVLGLGSAAEWLLV